MGPLKWKLYSINTIQSSKSIFFMIFLIPFCLDYFIVIQYIIQIVYQKTFTDRSHINKLLVISKR